MRMLLRTLAEMVLVLVVIGARSNSGQMDDHEAVGPSVAGACGNLQQRSYLVPPPSGRAWNGLMGLCNMHWKQKHINTHFCVYFHVHTHPHPFNSVRFLTGLPFNAQLDWFNFLNISLTCSEKDTLTDLYQHTGKTDHEASPGPALEYPVLGPETMQGPGRQNGPHGPSLLSPPGMPPKEVSSDNIYLFLMQTGQPSVRSQWAPNRFQSVLRGFFLCVLKFILM